MLIVLHSVPHTVPVGLSIGTVVQNTLLKCFRCLHWETEIYVRDSPLKFKLILVLFLFK